MTIWRETVGALLQTELASTVTYTPASGFPTPLRAFVATIEPEAGFGRSRQRREGIIVEFLRAGIAEPTEGASFVHEGRTFEVISAPLIADPDRLLWRLEAFGVEAPTPSPYMAPGYVAEGYATA